MFSQQQVNRESRSNLIWRKKIGKDPRIEENPGQEHLPSGHSLIGRGRTNSGYTGERSPVFFSRIPIQAKPASPSGRLTIGQPNDNYEQEADRVAEQVMRMPETAIVDISSGGDKIQRKCAACEKEEEEKIQMKPLASQITPLFQRSSKTLDEGGELVQTKTKGGVPAITPSFQSQLEVSKGGGSPLPGATNQFMSKAFGSDFGHVRIHSDSRAHRMNRDIQAKAFTHGSDIYFNRGQFSPGTSGGKRLLAHELTHVMQQTGGARSNAPAHVRSIQRVVEVRPPGRGEASAFDRRQELIDRLNAQSAAILYRLDGRVLLYDVIDEAALTNFDRQMRGFIDGANVLPLRLITSAGLVADPGTPFTPLLVDSFVLGYLDLDDLLASDERSFQMRLIHILTERSQSRNYARRIGGSFSIAEFNRVHRAGHEAQAEYLRDVIGDPTIRFISNETLANGTVLIMFRSAEGYRVFERFRAGGSRVRGGEVFVLTRDRRRLTIEQLIAERAAAAPAVP